MGDLVQGALGNVTNFFGGSKKADDLSKLAADRGDPFGDQRDMYQEMLRNLMNDPAGAMKNNPSFKFGMDQGLEAVMRKLSAGGMSGSGNEMMALQEFGTGYTMNFLNQQEQMLAQLSGAQIAPDFRAAVQAQQNSFDQANTVNQSVSKMIGGMMGGGGGGGGMSP